MKSLPWLRLYVDLPDNVKLRGLPTDTQLFFVWYLCLYRRGTIAGDTRPAQLAWVLHISEDDYTRHFKMLVDNRLLLADGTPKGWDERQTDIGVTDRMKRYRDKKKATVTDGCGMLRKVTNDAVTSQETEKETEKRREESERERGGQAADAHTPTPQALNSPGVDAALKDDAAQAAESNPPVTRAEADARAEQAGIAQNVVEKWWLFQQEQGWVNARGHRMTRDGAFSSLIRWKINEHRFVQADELAAKRIEAAEAIAARDGRNQANTSNFGRVASPRSVIARFRATVESLGKEAIYLAKFIEHDTKGMSAEDAAAVKAGYLAIMDGHPGCNE